MQKMKSKPRGSKLDIWASTRGTLQDVNPGVQLWSALSSNPKPKTITPTSQPGAPTVLQRSEGILQKRYGRPGRRIAGSGAGGSVQVLTRPSDGKMFAVKRFRSRHVFEDGLDYSKKILAEYYLGSRFSHSNIIKTIEIIQESGDWSQVMEYAPYLLFDSVMSGRMSLGEINCCFVQLLTGVDYLHNIGFAHRDLKLENLVITGNGIVKIIDFGCATDFQYTSPDSVTLSQGVSGCGPYMAPELYHSKYYDARKVDIWSMAIIYYCCICRHFPWQVAQIRDPCFREFVGPSSAASHRTSTTTSSISSTSTSHHDDEFSMTTCPNVNVHQITSSAPSTPSDGFLSRRSSVTFQCGVYVPSTLLDKLPLETRALMGAMLEIDPAIRPTTRQIRADPWLSKCPVCTEDENSRHHRAAGHQHTLEHG